MLNFYLLLLCQAHLVSFRYDTEMCFTLLVLRLQMACLHMAGYKFYVLTYLLILSVCPSFFRRPSVVIRPSVLRPSSFIVITASAACYFFFFFVPR